MIVATKTKLTVEQCREIEETASRIAKEITAEDGSGFSPAQVAEFDAATVAETEAWLETHCGDDYHAAADGELLALTVVHYVEKSRA